MPKRLLIIGLAFCALATACALAALDSLGSVLTWLLAVGAVLALPLGIGLVLGRPAARSCARGALLVLLTLSFAAASVFTLLTTVALLGQGGESLGLPGITLRGWRELAGVVLATLLLGVLSYVAQRQLDSDPVRAYCESH